MKCHKCGIENIPEATKCDCGYNFEKGKIDEQVNAPSKEKMQKKVGSGSVSAVVSIIIAVLSFIGAVPVALPVIGLVFGANAILKQSRIGKRNKAIKVTAIIALIINGFVTLMFIIGPFVRK